jgi:hypothetical protein
MLKFFRTVSTHAFCVRSCLDWRTTTGISLGRRRVNFSTSADFTTSHSPPDSLASIPTENGSQIGSEFGNSGNKCEIMYFVRTLLVVHPAQGPNIRRPLEPDPRKQQSPFSPPLLLPQKHQRLPKCVLLVAFFLRRPQALGSFQRFYQNEYNRICYDPRDFMALNEQRSNENCRHHG